MGENAIRRLYRAMDTQDLEVALELFDPDFEWIPDARVGEGPVSGREAAIAFLADRAEVFERLTTEVERIWELDDQVLAFIHVTGRGGASGAGFDIRIAHLWTMRDDRLVRGQGFGDRDAARRAAGLSEDDPPRP